MSGWEIFSYTLAMYPFVLLCVNVSWCVLLWRRGGLATENGTP